jgi:hypothetical protein
MASVESVGKRLLGEVEECGLDEVRYGAIEYSRSAF